MNDYVGMEEFTQRIMGEVIERSHGQVEDDQYEGNLPDFIENSFTQMMFDYLSDSGVIDDAEVCYFQYNTGSKTTKINGYSFDEERGILNIFVSLYYHVGTLTNVQSDEIQKACDQASEFYSLAIKGHHIKMEQASDQFDMVQRLYEVHDSIDQVRIHVLTNGLITQDTIDSRKIDGNVCKVLIHDLRQLHECIESGLVATIGVDFEKTLGSAIPCVSIPHNSSDYSTYLAIIPGIVFYELYDEYGTQLLELNVRAFLQTTGKVNRGIRETLQNEGNRFLAYNNGISITAEHIELSDDVSNGQAIVSIHGLQIVNGGQTMGSIYRAKKSGESDLKQVFVPVKITVINPDKVEEIVPKISRFSNTQNRVSEADFSSRDPFHVEIQRLSESIWIPGEQSRWFYERARGGYYETKARNATTLAKKRQFESVVPTSQKFTKTDLAKYVNCWDMLPDIVCFGTQKNFTHFMKGLRNQYGADWRPNVDYYRDLISKAIIFKATTKIVRQLQIPGYKAQAVAYTIAYIAYRAVGRIDLTSIWEQQDITEGVKATIRTWAPEILDNIIESANGRNVSEWCKKESCWNVIRTLKLPLPEKFAREIEDMQPLPTVGPPSKRRSGNLTDLDRENISRVMSIDAETWLRIFINGKRTGVIDEWLSGIAFTLAGYAASNWERIPSAKQAGRGVEILEVSSSLLDQREE